MKVQKVRSEELNRLIAAAVVESLKIAYGVKAGVKVTSIQTESQDLQPVGLKHNIRLEVQMTLNATDELENPS